MFCGRFLLLTVLIFAFASCAPASNSEPDHAVSESSKALERDETAYNEALRRLQLQPTIGHLDEILTELWPETYAGFWITTPRKPGVTVAASGKLDDYRSLIKGTPFEDQVTLIQVKRSLQALENKRKAATAYLRSRELDSAADVNIMENRVVIFVGNPRKIKSLIETDPAAASLSDVTFIKYFGLDQKRVQLPAAVQAGERADSITFLTYNSPVPSGLMAGIFGTLKVVDGCIRVVDSERKGATIVFPFLFSYRILKGKLELIYRGEVYAREGDKIGWNGFPEQADGPEIMGDVSRCPGSFWFR